jgi:hypothetical protein
MPAISMFYGITITMYREVGLKHHRPHFHARYGDFEASYYFDGTVEQGELPPPQHKRVVKWAKSHKTELEKNWELLVNKSKAIYIEP